MVMTGDESNKNGSLALVLSGGGARNAYHAGFLAELSQSFPELSFDILTGASAGAINLAHLAASEKPLPMALEDLVGIWSRIEMGDVFDVSTNSLAGHVASWAFRLLSGRPGKGPNMQGMVDTAPLRRLLQRELNTDGGPVKGIRENIERGRLRAIAVTATNYTTGRTVTFVQGQDIENWERANRVSMEVEIGVEHIMASTSLPFFFPAVKVGDAWYGDGGIRMNAPLAPAVHLGADRILAISTRFPRSAEQAERDRSPGYPPPAQILSTLFDAVFLDMFDYDAHQLERYNRLLYDLPKPLRGSLRPVKLLLIRPSQDLGRLANEYEPKLPRAFRFLTRGLGTRKSGNNDALSIISFQHEYLTRIMDIGRTDARANHEALSAFLTGDGFP